MTETGKDEIKGVVTAEDKFAGAISENEKKDKDNIAENFEPVVDAGSGLEFSFKSFVTGFTTEFAKQPDRASPATERFFGQESQNEQSKHHGQVKGSEGATELTDGDKSPKTFHPAEGAISLEGAFPVTQCQIYQHGEDDEHKTVTDIFYFHRLLSNYFQ